MLRDGPSESYLTRPVGKIRKDVYAGRVVSGEYRRIDAAQASQQVSRSARREPCGAQWANRDNDRLGLGSCADQDLSVVFHHLLVEGVDDVEQDDPDRLAECAPLGVRVLPYLGETSADAQATALLVQQFSELVDLAGLPPTGLPVLVQHLLSLTRSVNLHVRLDDLRKGLDLAIVGHALFLP